MTGRTVLLASLALSNLGAGVAVQLYLLARLGAGQETDAFFASSTLPQIAVAILVGTAVNVIVPLLVGRSRDAALARDVWTLLCWTGALLAALGAVIAALAFPLTDLLVPGLSPAARELTATLTLINALALPLSGLGLVAAGMHQARGRFVWSEATGALSNLALLAAVVWLLPLGGLVLVAWLFAARAAAHLLLLLPGLGAPQLSLARTPVVAEVARGMRPLLFSTSYFKLAPLVDRWLASFGAAGAISLLHLLQQVFAAAAAVTSKSIVNPLIVRLAGRRREGAGVGERRSLYLRLHRWTGLICLAGFAAGLAATWLVAPMVLPEWQARRLTVLAAALGGLYTAGFLGQLAAAWFYAEGDTGVPARAGAVGFTIGLAVRGALFPVLGTAAIALALSLTQVINWLTMHRRILKTPTS